MAITGTNLDPQTVLEWNDTNYQLVREIRTVDPVLGGAPTKASATPGEVDINSPVNFALATLAARTKWLKKEVKRIEGNIATKAEAEAGTDNTHFMTPLRTKEAIDALGGSGVTVATKAEAEAGTDNTKMMTPLRTREAISSLGGVFYYLKKWDLTGLNSEAKGIAYGNNTIFCVNHAATPAFYRYDVTGNYLGRWQTITSARDDTYGLTFANNKLVTLFRTSSNVSDELHFYSPSDGAYESKITISSTFASGVTYGNGKFWVVSDRVNEKKVFKYSTTGTEEASWALNSANSRAKGITYHGEYLYVVDADADAVFKYDEAGNYQSHSDLDSDNDGPQGITNINGKFLVVDNDDDVYEYGLLLMVS